MSMDALALLERELEGQPTTNELIHPEPRKEDA